MIITKREFPNFHHYETELAGRPLKVETGKMAQLANGSCLIRYGETAVLCAATGATLRVAPVDDRGQVQLDAYAKLLGPRTKLAALTQVSNALGTITPVGA